MKNIIFYLVDDGEIRCSENEWIEKILPVYTSVGESAGYTHNHAIKRKGETILIPHHAIVMIKVTEEEKEDKS